MSGFQRNTPRRENTADNNKASTVLLKPPIQIFFIVPAVIFAGTFADSRLLYLLFGIWVCILVGYGLSILILSLLPSYLLELHPRLISHMKKIMNTASILFYGGISGFLYLWLYIELKMPGSELLRELEK